MREPGQGFSLIEAMVVLALMGIAAAMAMPAWNGVVAKRRVGSTLEAMTSLLRLAQLTARARGQTLAMCPLGSDRRREIHGCKSISRPEPWRDGMLLFLPGDGGVSDYQAGRALRYVLFDRQVLVSGGGPFFVDPQGHFETDRPAFWRIVAGRACATLTVGNHGEPVQCHGATCPGCAS